LDFPTLAVPVPLVRVGGLLAGYPPWFSIIISEFELRSTMTNMVDPAFHHPITSLWAQKALKDAVKGE